MIHRIVSRVGSAEALEFWSERLTAEGVEAELSGDDRLRFADPEGLAHELAVVETADEPLVAEHPEISPALALQGFDSVRAYSSDSTASTELLEQALGFSPSGDGWEARGEKRGSRYFYDEPPEQAGVPGAGTVHHVAWASTMGEHEAWRERASEHGAHPTPVIDRFYFRSIYFREPSGVLFEIATMGPGFTSDEQLEHLGERVSLPPDYEHLREQVESKLTPLPNPRADWTER